MNAEILAIGTELLMGQIVNSNAQYISSRLPQVGVNVFYHSVVGDNSKRVEESIKLSLERSDVVIITGGLGPTKDDLTKETVTKTLNLKLVLHEESLTKIEEYFQKIGREMVESNKKQALFPEGSLIIENNKGTAPGCIIQDGNKVVIMLPGPPKEMIPMFEDTVIPYFRSKSDYKIVSRFLRVFGIGESTLETDIIDIIDSQTNPTVAPYVKDGEVTLRITAKCKQDEDGEAIIKPIMEKISERLVHNIYSFDNKDLNQVTGELLIEKGIKVAFAESCTGGLLSYMITSVPGISAIFKGSVVSYSNDIKASKLSVKNETLEKYGAVSPETAKEMAIGVRESFGTDIGVSITGVAGPGGTIEKPVGLVYVALASKDKVEVKELKLIGDRDRIRNLSALNALDMIRRFVLNL